MAQSVVFYAKYTRRAVWDGEEIAFQVLKPLGALELFLKSKRERFTVQWEKSFAWLIDQGEPGVFAVTPPT